jgi:branched-chain amino acid transport system permease protein
MMAIHAILASSIFIILSTGQLSLAHASFMSIGAYSSALLTTNLGISFWLSMPCAAFISAFVSLIIGLPTLRIKGVYFAIVTFAFAEIVRLTYIFWVKLFGGVGGIMNIPLPTPIKISSIIISFESKVSIYYLALFFACLIVFIIRRIYNSRIGKIFNAIEHEDLLTECLGINVFQYKLFAFVVGSFFAGIAGSLHAHYIGFIAPDIAYVMVSMDYIIFNIVGGMAGVFGPIFGSTFLMLFSEIVKGFKNFELIAYGAILIIVIFFLPRGILGILEDIDDRLTNFLTRRMSI